MVRASLNLGVRVAKSSSYYCEYHSTPLYWCYRIIMGLVFYHFNEIGINKDNRDKEK